MQRHGGERRTEVRVVVRARAAIAPGVEPEAVEPVRRSGYGTQGLSVKRGAVFMPLLPVAYQGKADALCRRRAKQFVGLGAEELPQHLLGRPRPQCISQGINGDDAKHGLSGLAHHGL